MNSALSRAATAVNGELHGTDRDFVGVSTDTRTLANGELFFALSGPNFDGGEFVAEAQRKGAAGAVVDTLVEDDIAQIRVDDTRLALGRLGSAWRSQQPATVVGVTGSNGKTTLKEMIAAILKTEAPTLATAGNLNNDIGVPLMLMRIESTHQFAVIEMGANHQTEIAYLTSLAKPDVVVISNAGPSHLEGFGSLDGVARGKGEILQGEPGPKVAVLNADDHYIDYWLSIAGDAEVIQFGLDNTADVYATDIDARSDAMRFTLHLPTASFALTLPLAGIHNVRNACAAAAIAQALNIAPEQIQAGLEALEPVSGRLRPIAGLNGSTIFDDSYNANPGSVQAAGEFLATLDGETWLVLGDMFELGDEAENLHARLGETLADCGIDRLLTLGDLSRHTASAFGDGGQAFQSVDKLNSALTDAIHAEVTVLVKGSRGMRMERVVEALSAGVTDVEGEAV